MVTGIPLLMLIFFAILLIVVMTSIGKVHPFIALLLATFGLGICVGMPLPEILSAINSGFGGLMGHIGLIVVIGSIIGVVLERSGAAMRIADLILKLVGRKRPAVAMSVVGSTVGIPVFCDSGFIILSGLNDAISRKTKVRKATLALALASGLYTTHTLVPPTPGPIAAAGNLGAGDYLGTVILLGILIAIPTAMLACFFAIRRGMKIETGADETEMEPVGDIPPPFQSLAPIVVPLLLIGAASVVKFMNIEAGWANWLYFLGNPLTALLIGLIVSFSLFRKWDEKHFTGWIGDGIKLAGPILIITGAGGAFGGLLKATPIADLVSSWVEGGQFSGMYFIIIVFCISALLKTSQGSSTNALVITSSIVAPLVITMGFDSPLELALLVMAIGGGAMTVSHANDSYFWVVSQFSGIGVRDAFRNYTLMTGLQGLTVLLMTLIIYAVAA